jgi:hypothetical protein
MSATATISRSKASDRQKAANRANAAKSTGPRTEAGKARSSQNAIRHGFYSDVVAVGDVEAQEFDSFRDVFIRSINPRDALELTQAERLAALQYRIGRLQRAESCLMQEEQVRLFKSLRDRFKRLEETREDEKDWDPRDRTFTEVQEQDIEFTNGLYTKPDDIEPCYALMRVAGDDALSAALERLSRLEQRMDTQLQRAWKLMRDLQDPDRPIGGEPSVLLSQIDRRAEQAERRREESDASEEPEQQVEQSENASVRNEANGTAIVEDATGYAACRSTAVPAVSGCSPAKGQSAGQSSLASRVLNEKPRE